MLVSCTDACLSVSIGFPKLSLHGLISQSSSDQALTANGPWCGSVAPQRVHLCKLAFGFLLFVFAWERLALLTHRRFTFADLSSGLEPWSCSGDRELVLATAHSTQLGV